MASDLSKRMVVRLSDAQLEWVGKMAADEGMDNATFVRVLIDRLSKGRPPLIGMMGRTIEIRSVDPAIHGAQPGATYYHAAEIREVDEVLAPSGNITDVLAQRAAEAEAAIADAPESAVDESPNGAIPLRRIPRAQYNPGRN